jgi:hypothetical protein
VPVVKMNRRCRWAKPLADCHWFGDDCIGYRELTFEFDKDMRWCHLERYYVTEWHSSVSLADLEPYRKNSLAYKAQHVYGDFGCANEKSRPEDDPPPYVFQPRYYDYRPRHYD